MTAETITHAPLDEALITAVGRTVVTVAGKRKDPIAWRQQVYLVRERLRTAEQTDNRYVHAVLSPHKISTATRDIDEAIDGNNHPQLMTRFGNIRTAIKRDTQPLALSAIHLVSAINAHTPDAKNGERVSVFAHLLSQAGIPVAALPPDTNPADRFNCHGDEALLVAGETLFLGFARNKPHIEAQAWTTPYANLPSVH